MKNYLLEYECQSTERCSVSVEAESLDQAIELGAEMTSEMESTSAKECSIRFKGLISKTDEYDLEG